MTATLPVSAEPRAVSARGSVFALAAALLAMSVDPSVHNLAFVGAAIADLVEDQVVHLGFTPQEGYAEMLRQSQG
jgi:hypothetical protein